MHKLEQVIITNASNWLHCHLTIDAPDVITAKKTNPGAKCMFSKDIKSHAKMLGSWSTTKTCAACECHAWTVCMMAMAWAIMSAISRTGACSCSEKESLLILQHSHQNWRQKISTRWLVYSLSFMLVFTYVPWISYHWSSERSMMIFFYLLRCPSLYHATLL